MKHRIKYFLRSIFRVVRTKIYKNEEINMPMFFYDIDVLKARGIYIFIFNKMVYSKRIDV